MKNRVTTYLLYAIGEIFLVVIGILIAVSIDNWNEEKKERKFEHKMLSEIQLALENDIIYFENNIRRLERLDSAIETTLSHIQKKAVYIDSTYNKAGFSSYNLAIGIVYQYNSGPYEALKATGVDKIKNDSLRKELITLYDFEYPRNKDFISYYEQDYRAQTEKLFDFQGDPFIEENNGKRYIREKFPPDLLQKPEFLKLLDDMRIRARAELAYFRYFVPYQRRVNNLLLNELNK